MRRSVLCKDIRVPVWAVMFGLIIYCNMVAFKTFVYDKDTAYDLLGGDDLHGLNNIASPLNDENNVPIPTDKYGNQMSLEERVRYLWHRSILRIKNETISVSQSN